MVREEEVEKFCPKCQEVKLIKEFNWMRKALGQRESQCKRCRAERKRLAYWDRKKDAT